MMGWLLSALSYIVFWLALPFLLLHPKLRAGKRHRLGFYPFHLPRQPGRPRIWVHGASAGDVLALLPTLRALRLRQPRLEVAISTITNSGRAMAERYSGLFLAIVYCPYDLPGSTRRAMRRLRPDVLMLEYTELWPQLIRSAQGMGVPVVLHNGRLADTRLAHYRFLFRLSGNLLQAMALLLMRDEQEAERALSLGAPSARVHITGNTKFDNLGERPAPARVAILAEALGLQPKVPLWVAGSTHEGEEERLLEVFVALKRTQPQLRMLIAPRYVERAERVVGLAHKQRLSARLRSQGTAATDVVVLDSIGELSACYALAELVFIGGSFVARGGQNILEPAACGRAVIFGPHMHNFADSVRVLLGRGGIQITSPEQLQRVMQDLLERPAYARELGATAEAQVRGIRGAAERNAGLIDALWPAPHGAQRRQPRPLWQTPAPRQI